jgi:dolichyl-phosphate-mannose-protein mannosyltransferase
MLIALGGWLGGYRGNWGFESEKVYPDDVPWRFWRAWCGVFGALTVPLAYYTALDMGLRQQGAILAGIMVLTGSFIHVEELIVVELGFITLARFILLDPFLLFFTALTTFCWVRFWSLREQAFTKKWWFWLFMTGANLGNTSSVKWLGLFMVATVGVHTVMDLWLLLANPRVTYRQYVMHWIARIICLIIVPIAVYVFWFDVHFKTLYKYGWQATEMPSSFQLRFHPNQYDGMPDYVAFNSKVRIKSAAWNGYHLQSVKGVEYPGGSKQQIVSGVRFGNSDNDRWMVERPWSQVEGEKAEHGFDNTDQWRQFDAERDKKGVQFIKSGDVIRLNHVPSGRNLHAHNIRANLTGRDWEATVFYTRDFGDPNDMWIVETIGTIPFLSGSKYIHPLSTRFLLRHNDSGCYLKAQTRQIPSDWGSGAAGSFEVTCTKWTTKYAPDVWWYIDGHDNDLCTFL